MSEERTKYSAEVKDVFSGDDLVLYVALGVDDLYKRKRVRLHGVDTPNAVGQGPDTEAGKIRNFVMSLLQRRTLTLTVVSLMRTGWIGVVEVETPQGLLNLNEILIGMGFKFNRDKGM